MKTRIILLTILLLITVCFTCMASAEESGIKRQGFLQRISLDLFGGFATLSPKDLNNLSDYRSDYENYKWKQRYDAYKTVNNVTCNYTMNLTPGSGFARISSALPYGLRARFHFNKTFSISLGVTSFDKTASAKYGAQYDLNIVDPDSTDYYTASKIEVEYPDFKLTAKAWAPMLGIHLQTWIFRRMTLEGHVAAGPLFAKCRAFYGYKVKTTFEDEFWTGFTYSTDLHGSGNGYAVELGGQLSIPLGSHFGFFVETVYSLQRVGKINGTYDYDDTFEDANSAPYSTSTSYNGTWRTVSYTYSNTWGSFSASWPTIRDPDNIANSDPFKLNLSGFQVRTGISWSF